MKSELQSTRFRSGFSLFMLTALLLLGSVFQTGCVALVIPAVVSTAGLTVETYLRGEYNSYVDVPASRCVLAVQDVAYHLRFETVRSENRGTVDVFEFRNIDGVPFRIKVEPLTGDSARVSIRAGIWGDKVCSAKLVSEIRKSAHCPEPR